MLNLDDLMLPLLNEHTLVEIEYVNLPKYEARAVLLKRFLSSDDCERLVKLIDSRDRLPRCDDDSTLLATCSKVEYRNNKRILGNGEQVASALFDRLQPFLMILNEETKSCDDNNAHQFLHNGFSMSGSWIAYGLNSCFRLCKYDELGHFGPHCDSDYVVCPSSNRSLKTFMLYLNDDYSGGETNFCDDHDMFLDEVRKIYCSPSHSIHTSIKASKGDCLIFDHKMLHEGAQVLSGQKYIMRSEVMYKKLPPDGTIVANADQQAQEVAAQLYHEGMALEDRGDIDGAVALYRRAIKVCPDIEQYM